MKPRASTSGLHSAMLICCLGLFAASPSLMRSAAAEEQPAPASYDIPALPLAQALALFGQQAGVQLTAAADLTRDRHSAPLTGEYPIEEALRRLLADSGLEARRTAPSTFELVAQPQTERPAESPPAPRLPATRLSPLLVQAERPEDETYLRPYAVSHISREDIERIGARHASEILQATPGVFTVTNEQVPSVSVDIRGFKDFGRVNMNIDGMRQNYQRTGHGQRNGEIFFDTEFLSSVEISKGIHAGAGGAGATGGVATFRTLEADDILDDHDDFGGRLRLSHGVPEWENGQNLSGSLALAARPTDRTDVLLAYSRRNTGEYKPGQRGNALYHGQFEDQPGYELPSSIVTATGQDMESWLGKARWRPAAIDGLELKLTALSASMSYGESQSMNEDGAYRQYLKERLCGDPPSAVVEDDPEAYDYYCGFEYDPESLYPVTHSNRTASQSHAVDLSYAPGNDWLDVKAKFYRVSTRNTSNRIDSTATYRVKTRTETLGALLSNTTRFHLGRHLLAFDYGLESFRDENRPDADSQTLTGQQISLLSGATPQGQRQITGTWLKADWNYRALTVSPALRYEHYRLWGLTGFRDVDARPDSPNLGQILWQFAQIDVDRSNASVLPSLGLALDLIEQPRQQLQGFANAALGWRPPAITETLTASTIPFHFPPVTTYPNWMLEPEKTRSAEIGLNWRLGAADKRLNVKLVQFHNRTENYIVLGAYTHKPGTPNDTLAMESVFVNALNDLIFTGQELQIDFALNSVYGAFNLTHLLTKYSPARTRPDGGTYNALDYRPWPLGGPDGESPVTYCPDRDRDRFRTDDGECVAWGSNYDPLIPQWTGKLTLGKRWLRDMLDTSASLTCASQTGDPLYSGAHGYARLPGENEGLRGFCVTDFYASYRPISTLRLGLNLKNLTDREYIQALGDGMVKSYAPGRTLTAYLQWNF